MNRWIKSLLDMLAAIATLGFLALMWLLVTQVIAIALAAAVGLAVAFAYEWPSGLVAGVVAYAVLMKLATYLEIFDMIGLPTKRRAKSETKRPPAV